MPDLDNSSYVRPFVPATNDGDSFIYTEMLDRSNRKGNNGHRLVKTFYHRSTEEFDSQLPTIKVLCDLTGSRAVTRLATRSFKKVGREFTKMVVEASLTDNWAGMKTLYNHALGTVKPTHNLWLFDVDNPTEQSEFFSEWLAERSESENAVMHRIPSRKGYHLITVPFDIRSAAFALDDARYNVTLHKNNPTNLYIPEGAA